MTVSSETRKAGPFTGNGVTDTFPFVFKVFSATDVVVVSADASGAETTLVLDSDYTLTLNEMQDDDPGGSIVTVAPLATGHRLVITSEVPRTNETEITNSGGFYPGVLNPALDKLTILVQQQEEKTSRALLLPVTSEATHADLASALLRVDPISDDVVAVADIAAAVTAVAAIDDDVAVVADHIDSVSTFAAVYQGPATSDPTLRNNGDPLLEGDLYFNTVSQSMRSYSGSAWLDYEADAEAAQVAAEAAQVLAESAQASAELAEVAAESARDAAIIGAGVYVDEPTGRAAVADGAAFKVQGTGDVAAYEYRRVNAGSSTLIATYPSAAYIAKKASMDEMYHQLYAKEDFESGYPERFWTYSNVNQYVAARYQSNALAGSVALGSAQLFSRAVGSPIGLRVRFTIKVPSGAVPTFVAGLTDATSSFDSNRNVGIWFAASNTPAACFRVDYSAIDSSRTTAAGTDSAATALDKTYYLQLEFLGHKVVVKYFSDSTFATVSASYEKSIDITKYAPMTRFIIYSASATGMMVKDVMFNPDNYVKPAASITNKGWLNYLSPADCAGAGSYFFEDWTRRTTTSASAQGNGNFTIPGTDGCFVVKFNIDTSNTVDGFLVGFGGNTSSKRALIGYEPSLAQRGFVFYNGASSTFSMIKPVAELTSGTYYGRVSKRSTTYIAEIATDPQFTDVIGTVTANASGLDSQVPRVSIKAVTASVSLVEWVQYSERALGHIAAAERGGAAALVPDGSNVYITQFEGGAGNNWCFVRTPSTYSASGAPLPMVILNHGNGWTMNGTVAKANFSEKTQFGVDTQNGGTYLDTGRADYVQYSNPLIELLLDNGFVVCGAQNYGDSLYGNNNCRNAVADFYEWMLRNFNVKDRCHMVGASNGVMTTLNACHILGIGKVASIAGVYPLCDLIDHYLGYPSHRAGIESAYGLTPPYADKAALLAEAKLFTHCPVNHYVVGASDSTTVRTAPLPPMKLVASGGDTVTAAVNNGEKLRDLCLRSRLVCEYTDIDPGGALGYDHGDWHHFKEQEIVDFFIAHK